MRLGLGVAALVAVQVRQGLATMELFHKEGARRTACP